MIIDVIDQICSVKVTRKNGDSCFFDIPDDAKNFNIPADKNNPAISVRFFRRQPSPWNTQFFRALKELVSFKSEFPYVSFFNFGNTLMSREPVTDVLKRGIGPSLALMLPIFAGEIFFGIVLALLALQFKF